MPTANLLDEDDWTAVPVGPGNMDPIVSAVWRGYWDGVNNRVRWLFNRLLVPLLGPYKTFLPGAVDTAADTISIPSHGLSTDDLVRFGNVGGTAFSIVGSPLTLLAGLNAQPFYAIKVDNDTIQLSLSVGGAALDLTAAGTGTHYLFIVTGATFTALVHSAFTPAGASAEVPAGSLYVTLGAYMLSVFGGRLQGPIRHYTAGAKIVDRTTSSNLPSVGDADATLTGFENYPCYRVPDQSANHVFTLPAPSEAGIRVRLMRVDASGGFGAAFKRGDASTIVALNAVGGADLHSYDSGDGKGLAWHAVGFGGASAVS